MFKNSVFNVSVNTVNWIKKSSIRAVKTFAQTLTGFITIGAAMKDIDWGFALSVSAAACIASILTSVAGIPEVKNNESEEN